MWYKLPVQYDSLPKRIVMKWNDNWGLCSVTLNRKQNPRRSREVWTLENLVSIFDLSRLNSAAREL